MQWTVKLVIREYVHFKLRECWGLVVKCPLNWSYFWNLGSQMVELYEKVMETLGGRNWNDWLAGGKPWGATYLLHILWFLNVDGYDQPASYTCCHDSADVELSFCFFFLVDWSFWNWKHKYIISILQFFMTRRK